MLVCGYFVNQDRFPTRGSVPASGYVGNSADRNFALRAAPSARHRAAVADGRFGEGWASTPSPSNPPRSARRALLLSAKDAKTKGHPRVAFLFSHLWRREASALRRLRGGFEGLGLPAQPSPNRPTATAAQQQ